MKGLANEEQTGEMPVNRGGGGGDHIWGEGRGDCKRGGGGGGYYKRREDYREEEEEVERNT